MQVIEIFQQAIWLQLNNFHHHFQHGLRAWLLFRERELHVLDVNPY
jgi:hypothetical protein